MAYGTKYRASFVDRYDRAVQVDLKKEDYSSSVTTINPAYPSLSIEWNGNRDDIFNPVRGALARFSVWAEVVDQFNEFFDAYEKQWQMEVSIAGSVYWTGWVMVGDHIESCRAAPYVVTFMAYDLGVLQAVEYDNTLEDDDTILDVIQECLSQTGIDLSVKERVNIYEDSINNDQDDSVLNQINIHQPVVFDEDWTGATCYDVLAMELMPFNAFVMQENNLWNIVRVADMKYVHNYRVFNTSGSRTDYGDDEDFTKALSSYSIINSPVMMAVPSWKNLNLFQDYGLKNLVHQGRFNKQITLTDFWTGTGTGSATYVDTDTVTNINGEFTGGGALRISSGLGTSNLALEHNMQYSVLSGSTVRLQINYRVAYYDVGGAGTPTIGFYVDNYYSSSNHRIQLDGSWGTVNTDTDDIVVPFREFVEGSFVTEPFGGDGTLILTITDVRGITGASACYTFWDYFEVIPIIGSRGTATKDYTEVLNAKNITEPDDIIIYHGDSEYSTTGRELLAGSYATTGGATTDSWQSLAGSHPGKVVQLCADCYKAQRETTVRRLQSTIKGQLNYLDVMYDADGRYFIPSSLTYDVDDSEWSGERIEYKTGWGDDLVDTWRNGAYGSSLYEGFTDYGSYLLLYKIQTSTNALVTLDNTPLVAGVRYKITADIYMTSGSIPNVNIGGTNKTDLIDGYNEWEIIADTTEDTHFGIIYNTSAEQAQFTIALTVQEAYGI